MIKIETTIEECGNNVTISSSESCSHKTNLEELLSAACRKALRPVQAVDWTTCKSCGYEGTPLVTVRQTMDTADGIHIAWRTIQCPSCKRVLEEYE